MKLAREFRRPDWRAMLAGMSSTELAEWGRYYQQQYFENDLLDAHFSRLSHLVVSVMWPETEQTPLNFSLLNPPELETLPMDDDVMMSVAESLGGVRYGTVSG